MEYEKNSAEYTATQEVIFRCPILGVWMEIRGTIQEVVRTPGKREVSYRILVGEDSRLKHQNCIYGGILNRNILRKIE